MTLQAYAQLFLARGHYDDFSFFARGPAATPTIHLTDLEPLSGRPPGNPDFQRAGVNASVILRWEYQLGSLFYLVYTRAQTPQTVLGPDQTPRLDLSALPRAPSSDVLLCKLTWWWG